MKKALLVIDMQNIFVGKNSAKYIFKYNKDKLISSVNNIIDINKDNLVIYIKNIMTNNLFNRMFAPFKAFDNTNEVELIDKLKVTSQNIFKKYKGDAFSNKDLLTFLRKNNIEEIEIIGLDGGGCVSLTAMGAIKNGFKVTLNTNAIGTTFEKRKERYYKKLEKLGAEFI